MAQQSFSDSQANSRSLEGSRYCWRKKTKENRETPSLEEEVAFYWQQMNFAVICYHKLPGTVKQQSFKYSIFKIYLFFFFTQIKIWGYYKEWLHLHTTQLQMALRDTLIWG